MLAVLKKQKRTIGFIFCIVWLTITVAFFAMITSGGEANMELEIGPFLELKGRSAVLFTRSLIGFGLLMLILFIWRRRIGYVLALIWSVWWGGILLTAFFSPSNFSDRISNLIIFHLFIISTLFSLAHLKDKRSATGQKP